MLRFSVNDLVLQLFKVQLIGYMYQHGAMICHMVNLSSFAIW